MREFILYKYKFHVAIVNVARTMTTFLFEVVTLTLPATQNLHSKRRFVCFPLPKSKNVKKPQPPPPPPSLSIVFSLSFSLASCFIQLFSFSRSLAFSLSFCCFFLQFDGRRRRRLSRWRDDRAADAADGCLAFGIGRRRAVIVHIGRQRSRSDRFFEFLAESSQGC